MLNLTDNQLKYLAYGAIGLILIVLLLNIFLTKINNNYNNSTFESFGNMREGMENKKDKSSLDEIKKNLDKSLEITTIKDIMCGSSSKEKIKDFSDAFKEDIPKIQGYLVYFLMQLVVEEFNPKLQKKEKDYIKTKISGLKESINTLNVINDNIHYLDQECRNSIMNYSSKNDKDKSNSSSRSWF